MSHIFISYSRRDIDFAQKIVDALAANNLDTWIDWKSIPKGEDWEQEIYRDIEEADAFLFLISPDSVASPMCNKEIAHAIKNGKRILPIVIRDADLKSIHPEISKRNWVFCRDGQDDFNKAIEATRETIHTDYEWLKYHTELQVKALKWEQKKDNSRLLRGKELREAEQQLAEISSREDPQPTKIQREYVLASQRNEIRTRRQITIGLVVGLGIMVVLASVAWGQRNSAISAQSTAVAEANARATAQANAEQQAKIALAKQLAAQSALLLSEDRDIPASLLALESLRNYQTTEGIQAIRNGLTLVPLIKNKLIDDGTINSMKFSPDGKSIITGSYGGTARGWDVLSGNEISHFKHTGGVNSIALSPDGQLAVSGGEDGFAVVWDVVTGIEKTYLI